MATITLAALLERAAKADGPSITPPTNPVLGGVDPLGLRQVNFDMMDQVLPGINNVGRHVRPYVVTSWACRRAAALASDAELEAIDIRDFVDRVEVLFAWSQFLKRADADLPGRQALGHIIAAEAYTFGGDAWQRLRVNRRYSTAFTAPITYGPAIKNLGWAAPHLAHPEALIALPEVFPALDAFEAAIGAFLDHPALSSLEPVTVTQSEARQWADAWDLYEPTPAEKRVASELLFGTLARRERRNGMALLFRAVEHAGSSDTDAVRKTLCGEPTDFSAPGELVQTAVVWRRLQVRQLFRFALETLFYWIGQQLLAGPSTSDALADAFLAQAGAADAGDCSSWLSSLIPGDVGPTDLMQRLQVALSAADRTAIPAQIAAGIAFALKEAPSSGEPFERPDRLPLYRAKHEAARYTQQPASEFLRHVVENWILAQHVYWSVGRGLADARARGKQILRLKVVLEEQGWELAPGTYPPTIPVPTPDRLQTALTLARECGVISDHTRS